MNDKYKKVIYSNMNNDYIFNLCKYLSDKYFKNKDGKLLDIGCGTGHHLLSFSKLGYSTYGLDIRDCNISNTLVCDIEKDKFPYNNDSFDYIFSKSLIEHIHKPDNLLNECYRVLKPNGIIVIMTPDWKSQMKFFWDDYSHYHAWTKKSLKDALDIFGFTNSTCNEFLQLPFIWKRSYLLFIPKILSLLPDKLKWKTKDMRNGEDRKLIRFSKEKMLIGVAKK